MKKGLYPRDLELHFVCVTTCVCFVYFPINCDKSIRNSFYIYVSCILKPIFKRNLDRKCHATMSLTNQKPVCTSRTWGVVRWCDGAG